MKNHLENIPAIVESEYRTEIQQINADDKHVLEFEDEADETLWQQAQRVVRLLERGMTQRALASQWINARTGEAYSAMHVMRTARVWTCNVNVTDRPRFRDAYNQVANAAAKVKNIGSSESNEWYTPADYIEAARRVMGSIDLDPASSEEANKTVKATEFYSIDDDGLEKQWRGNVWLNPPYGDAGPEFVARATADFSAGAIQQIVILANSHCTDAAWFQSLWDGLLCFTRGRINFRKPGGDEISGSTHGSVFVYFGTQKKSFIREFSAFGAVVCRRG